MSTLAIFGAAALSRATQAEADAAMDLVISTGVNHIDVAPSYGHAEERLGRWLARERDRFFLGCKTQERTKKAASAELRRSLKRLQVEAFDLFQLHAVTSLEDSLPGLEGGSAEPSRGGQVGAGTLVEFGDGVVAVGDEQPRGEVSGLCDVLVPIAHGLSHRVVLVLSEDQPAMAPVHLHGLMR